MRTGLGRVEQLVESHGQRLDTMLRLHIEQWTQVQDRMDRLDTRVGKLEGEER